MGSMLASGDDELPTVLARRNSSRISCVSGFRKRPPGAWSLPYSR
jgi:hypothetical protein